MNMYKGLDHFAIAVGDTEEALKIWRDKFGFTVLYSEKVNNETVLLTHLDLGNTQLQLVQPLISPHPIWDWLEKNGGSGLHHFCLKVADVAGAAEAIKEKDLVPATKFHQGTKGKRALFIQSNSTGGVQVELTGK
jgi:methylmalonyl-CoA/ethylmalonyl-CoA epimerase